MRISPIPSRNRKVAAQKDEILGRESESRVVSVSGGAKKVPAITLLRHTWPATVHWVGGPWVVASPPSQPEPWPCRQESGDGKLQVWAYDWHC